MDTNIRNLLLLAEKTGGESSLLEAFRLLRTDTGPVIDKPDVFNNDLYVLCAETAYQLYNNVEIAEDCLKLFFQRSPVTNQFLCRAYLCQAQICAPTSAQNSEHLDSAVVFLLKAINLAKENKRYHFLIYNASVIFWKFARPFLKLNYRRHLAVSLHQVVKALDDIEDSDYEWRAQLMIALVECHMDAGHRNDASSIAATASVFIQRYVPAYFNTLFTIMVHYQLMDASKLDKMSRSSPELTAYYRIRKLKNAIEQNESSEVSVRDEARNILSQLSTEARKSLKDGVTQLSENKAFPPKKPRHSGSKTSALSAESKHRPHLLLELGRLALQQNLKDVAAECIEQLRTIAVDDESFAMESEFMECALMVCNLQEKQQSYDKSVVEVRLSAVRRCDEALSSAIRGGLSAAIQAGCSTQWNLCLPLLQNNLRKHVRRPLTSVADALERIESLLIQLRCQVHMELAKCEEDREQIQVALDHLKKAVLLDDGQVYEERLQVALQRLQLRAELYEQPEREEDQAAMMIEQARKADFGTIRMKRSLLVRAGQALAPDSFLLVLESESDTKVTAAGAKLSVLAGRANQFTTCVHKAAAHLRRLGDRADRERAALWGDLAKTARKQEVWDVCRVACRFCLLYDDGRWKNQVATPTALISSPRNRLKSAEDPPVDSDMAIESKVTRELTVTKPEQGVALYDRDLIRMMAEVNFVNGEALIHLLRCEGGELGDLPPTPIVKQKRKEKPVRVEEDPNWITYCNWLKSLSKHATSCFSRAIKLATELNERWIACCAATYMWNYNVHHMLRGGYDTIVSPMQTALNGLRQLGHEGETTLLVNICTALATGLVQPWLPPSVPKQPIFPNAPVAVEKPDKPKSPGKGRKSPLTAKSTKVVSPSVTISPEAMPSLRKALEVCEYGMTVTNGDNAQDIVSIATRRPLLEIWVAVKQMMQSQIARTLSTEDETNMECQRGMTRAIVAVRMLELNSNGIMDFKEVPSLSQTVELMLAAQWSDQLTYLHLWVRLAYLGLQAKDHNVVSTCAEQASQIANSMMPEISEKSVQCCELMSNVCMILGQSLIENSVGKSSLRHLALTEFVNSAHYARHANSPTLLIAAVRRYWNAALPLVSQPIERELLRQPIKSLIDDLNETTDLLAFRNNKEDGDEDGTSSAISHTVSASRPEEDHSEVKTGELPSSVPAGGTITVEDDLMLRVALYGVLFQCYADKGEWMEGLAAMDQAVADMPRTRHRLMIYKHLVLVKAKLGIDITGSVQKFKGENEEQLSQLWRRVALSCGTRQTQMLAYMNAIEALSGVSYDWHKLDTLLEFAQWLYCAELPLSDAASVLNWALDILQQMNTENAQPKTDASIGKRKKSRRLESGKSVKKEPQVAASQESDKGVSISVSNEPELTPTGVIPVEKHVVIGVVPSEKSLSISGYWDVRQMEYLIRTHTMLAEMYAFGSDCQHHCFMAYSYVLRIWQVVLTSSVGALQEIARNPPLETSKLSAKAKVKKEKENGRKGKKLKQDVAERPKRRLAIDSIPQTLDEWSSYDMPDEILQVSEHQLLTHNAINSQTFAKPLLSLHYLDILTKKLHHLGFNQFNLPILALIEVLSRQLVKSEPLKCLTHLRAYEVCLELDLPNGCDFHQYFIHYAVNEDEQARSREELTRYQDRMTQVIREEAAIRATLKSVSMNESNRMELRLQSRGAKSMVSAEAAPINHLGTKLTTLQLRNVWADTAEVLMRNGMYQPARQLLNESNMAAQAYDDKALQSRVMYLFAKLSYQEAHYDQAINMCLEAQNLYDGDEMFWYQTISLMSVCYLNDYKLCEVDRCKQATLVLDHAIEVFQTLALTRPNKAPVIRYILAKLQAKHGMSDAMCALQTQEKWSLLMKVDSETDILSNSAREEAENDLLTMGCQREAIGAINQRLSILRSVIDCSVTVSLKHAYYSKTLEAQEQAVQISVSMLNEALALSSTRELSRVSLAAERETADARLKCVHLMCEIFEMFEKEQRQETNCKQQRTDMVQVLDEIIQETPTYTDNEQHWNHLTSTLPERILAHLESAHGLVGNNLKLKAKVLFYTGRCMRLLALLKNPDRPLLWQVDTLSLLKTIQPQVEQSNVSNVFVDDDESNEFELPVGMTNRQADRYRNTVIIAQQMQTDSLSFLTQATECLCQAMNLALQKGLRDVAGMASLELVECIGEFDPGLASQLLALHQSCTTSAYLEDLLNRATRDTSLSQISALLRQRSNLSSESCLRTNMEGKTGHLNKINQCLQDNSLAYKRLKVSSHHLDFIKEFPSSFTFLVLQHSPDKSRLYGAVLDPMKAGARSPQKGAPPPSSKARIVSAEVTQSTFQDIMSRYSQFKNEIRQHLLKAEYQKTRSSACDITTADTPVNGSTNLSERDEVHKKLKQDYAILLENLAQYLEPVLSQLSAVLNRLRSRSKIQIEPTLNTSLSLHDTTVAAKRSPSTSDITLVKTKQKSRHKQAKEKPVKGKAIAKDATQKKKSATVSIGSHTKDTTAPPDDYLVLLLDEYLLQLPLEELPVFIESDCTSLTRDISLQMFYNRFHVEKLDEAGEKLKKEKDKLKPPPRILGLRDASKKQSKIIPLDRPVASGFMPVDTHTFRYIVDPHVDCSDAEIKKPIDVFSTVLEQHIQQFTPRWLGIMGNEHTPSQAEYEVYMLEGSAFIFYGFERFLSYLPPHKVAAMNFPDCQLVMLMDQNQTSRSFSRQSTIDVNKRQDELDLENPFETAMLLSLSGVNCLYANLWHSTIADNAQNMEVTMKNLLTNGKTSGESVRIASLDRHHCSSSVELTPPSSSLDVITASRPTILTGRMTGVMVCYGLPSLVVTQLSSK